MRTRVTQCGKSIHFEAKDESRSKCGILRGIKMSIFLRNRDKLFLFILSSLAIACCQQVFCDETQLEFVRALKKGLEQQLCEAEFKCTYTYSSYVVDTLEEAENFDTSQGRLVVHATGTLAKTKKMTYESFVLDTLKSTVPDYFMDQVTVTNQELRAKYFKQSLDHPYRTLFVAERKEKDRHFPVLARIRSNFICPLNILSPTVRPSLSDLLVAENNKYIEYASLTIESGLDLTTINMHYDKPGSKTLDWIYTISNNHPYPLLVKSKSRLIFPGQQNAQEITSSVATSDYVQLNDGSVLPQKVSQYRRILFDVFGEENIGKWLVSKWESDDMGKEKPKKSDFFIYLDRDSDIGGLAPNLNYKINKNLPEYFDINKYGVRDLQTSSPIETQVDRQSDLIVWIRPAILLIAGFFIVYGIWKKWKATRRDIAG